MLLTKPDVDADVTELARTIKTAQAPEIDQMTGWLTGWGQTVMPSMDMGHAMSGGMSDDEMAKLDQATGKEAAKLFLLLRPHAPRALTAVQVDDLLATFG